MSQQLILPKKKVTKKCICGKILTNNLYQKEFGVSRQTASRDLKELIDKGQIYSTGKGKGTKYKAVNIDEA